MYKSKRIISLILCFILVLGMIPSTPVLAASPNITTEAASNIGYYKATVSAYVATNGGNYFEEHGFYYGTTSSCRTKVVVDDNGGSGTSIDTPARYKYTFDDLDIGTKYYYKAYVLTTDGTYYYGGVGNFTTDDDDVNPSINPISSSAGTSFDYGTSTTFSTKASDNVELDEIEMLIDGDSVKTVTSNADAGVSKSISYTTDDLEAGTHTVTVKAWDVAGNMNQTAITVTVNEAEDTTNPSINPITSSAGTSFDHKTSTTFSTKASDDVELDKIQMLIDGTSVKTVNTNADAGVSQSISYTTDDLDVGTHTVTVKAWDVAGNMNQTAITVTVNKVYHIEVTTVDTSGDETTTSIVMEGKLSLEGSYEVATVGFEYKKVNGAATTVDMNRDYTDGETFSDELTDLEPNTSYQYRAFGQIYGYGKEYGNWVTITTKDEADYLPEVMTYDAEDIATNSVTLCGKLLSTGEATVSTEYGFVFNYSSNNSTTFKVGTSTSAKTFEYELTGIDDDHTYTYKSYAKNEYGTVYGEEVSFTTKELDRVQLAAPQLENTSITTSAGEPVTISWTAVPNATEYNVYIWDGLGAEVSRSIEQSALTYSYTFESVGTYYVQVYALNSASEVYTDSEPGEVTITVQTSVVDEVLLGDVNSDGAVTNKDRFILNRYLAGMDGYTLDMINFEATDINGDSDIDWNDLEILSKHLAHYPEYSSLLYFYTPPVPPSFNDTSVWEMKYNSTNTKIIVSKVSGNHNPNIEYLFIAEDEFGKHYYQSIPAGKTSVEFSIGAWCDVFKVEGKWTFKRGDHYKFYVVPSGVSLDDTNRRDFLVNEGRLPLYTGNMIVSVSSGGRSIRSGGEALAGEPLVIDWNGSHTVNNFELTVTINGTTLDYSFDSEGPGKIVIPGEKMLIGNIRILGAVTCGSLSHVSTWDGQIAEKSTDDDVTLSIPQYSMHIDDPYFYPNGLLIPYVDYFTSGNPFFIAEKGTYYAVKIIDNTTGQQVAYGDIEYLTWDVSPNYGDTIDKYGTLCLNSERKMFYLNLRYRGVIIDRIAIFTTGEDARIVTADIYRGIPNEAIEFSPESRMVKQSFSQMGNGNTQYNATYYNDSAADYGVASFDKNGEMADLDIVNGEWENASFVDGITQLTGWIKDIYTYISDSTSRSPGTSDTFNNPTRISVNVPNGGYVLFLNSNESQEVRNRNIAFIIAGLLDFGGDVCDLAVTKKKLAENDDVVLEIVEWLEDEDNSVAAEIMKIIVVPTIEEDWPKLIADVWNAITSDGAAYNQLLETLDKTLGINSENAGSLVKNLAKDGENVLLRGMPMAYYMMNGVDAVCSGTSLAKAIITLYTQKTENYTWMDRGICIVFPNS